MVRNGTDARSKSGIVLRRCGPWLVQPSKDEVELTRATLASISALVNEWLKSLTPGHTFVWRQWGRPSFWLRFDAMLEGQRIVYHEVEAQPCGVTFCLRQPAFNQRWQAATDVHLLPSFRVVASAKRVTDDAEWAGPNFSLAKIESETEIGSPGLVLVRCLPEEVLSFQRIEQWAVSPIGARPSVATHLLGFPDPCGQQMISLFMVLHLKTGVYKPVGGCWLNGRGGEVPTGGMLAWPPVD